MRILTKTQYDAICDIVTEKDNKIKELEAEIAKKNKTIDYLNAKIFNKKNKEIIMLRFKQTPMVCIASVDDLDFPATQKPEDKLF